jgi:hypothetical protein
VHDIRGAIIVSVLSEFLKVWDLTTDWVLHSDQEVSGTVIWGTPSTPKHGWKTSSKQTIKTVSGCTPGSPKAKLGQTLSYSNLGQIALPPTVSHAHLMRGSPDTLS